MHMRGAHIALRFCGTSQWVYGDVEEVDDKDFLFIVRYSVAEGGRTSIRETTLAYPAITAEHPTEWRVVDDITDDGSDDGSGAREGAAAHANSLR